MRKGSRNTYEKLNGLAGRLFDVLQAAGGLTEKAANRGVITPLGSDDPITVELSKDPVEMAKNNVEIKPGDTVVGPGLPSSRI
jgi:hypothetical protein